MTQQERTKKKVQHQECSQTSDLRELDEYGSKGSIFKKTQKGNRNKEGKIY